MYIYHLPYNERKDLCYILDNNDKWEELAAVYMKYDLQTIDMIKKVIYQSKSPTDELFTIWGHQNHTILELFVLLSRMKMFRAMSIIKHLIEDKYHFLLDNEIDRLNQIMKDLNKPEKKCINHIDSKIKPENFVGNNEKLLVPKFINEALTKDNNESTIEKNGIILPKSPTPLAKSRLATVSDISIVAESAGGIPSIPYEELTESTSNWDEKNVLGKGGFGKVYKGGFKNFYFFINLFHKWQH